MPVLHRGDLVVWDSLAISEYVNETFLDGRGWPVDANERAVARAISAEMHSGFQTLRNELPLNCRRRARNFVVSPDARRDIERITRIWRECRAHAGEGAYLFGAFSIVDAMYAPVVHRFRTYAIEVTPETQAYMDTMMAMPAFQQWTRDGLAETLVIEKFENV